MLGLLINITITSCFVRLSIACRNNFSDRNNLYPEKGKVSEELEASNSVGMMKGEHSHISTWNPRFVSNWTPKRTKLFSDKHFFLSSKNIWNFFWTLLLNVFWVRKTDKTFFRETFFQFEKCLKLFLHLTFKRFSSTIRKHQEAS